MRWTRSVIAIALVLSASVASSQSRLPVETETIESEAVGRKLKYQIILPNDYGKNDERRYPVLYLLHGHGGNYTDWARALGAPSYASEYELIFVMPDAGNSRYVNWSSSEDGQKNAWEDYIINELIPHIDQRYRTETGREGRAIDGLSMGGFGAMMLGLRHPELFSSIGAISGSLASARRAAERLKAGEAAPERSRTPEQETRHRADNPVIDIEDFSSQEARTPKGVIYETARVASAYDPFRLVARVPSRARPHIYLDCGTEDRLIESNKAFAEVLMRNDIPFVYSQTPGGHDASFWTEALGRAIAVHYEVMQRNLGRRPEARRRH